MLNNDAFIAQFKKKLSESGFELTKKEVKQIVQVNKNRKKSTDKQGNQNSCKEQRKVQIDGKL